MTYYCDTHCHLYMDQYGNDLEEILDEARNQDVNRILIPGVDLETSRAAIKLADKYENLYAAVGVHPHDAKYWKSDWRAQIMELCSHPKVVAIGEIGLDFFRNYSPVDIQNEVFRVQLEIALDLKIPVILHERNSADEIWAIIKEMANDFMNLFHDNWGVFHSFSSSLDYALRAIEHNLMIGVSGPVTYKNALDKQACISKLPLEAMLLETDGPYLPPHPHRGKRNLPQYIPIIAEKIAELKSCSLEQVRDITTTNANHLFSWRSDP